MEIGSPNKNKGVAYDSSGNKDEIHSDCSICMESLVDDARTLVKLRCSHQFHLDCIGSAFNSKNKMECPLCRNVEEGRWMYASGRPCGDIDLDLRQFIPQPHELDFGFSYNVPFMSVYPPLDLHGYVFPSIERHQHGSTFFPSSVWYNPEGPNQARLAANEQHMMNRGDGASSSSGRAGGSSSGWAGNRSGGRYHRRRPY